jgi:hypothetical protein
MHILLLNTQVLSSVFLESLNIDCLSLYQDMALSESDTSLLSNIPSNMVVTTSLIAKDCLLSSLPFLRSKTRLRGVTVASDSAFGIPLSSVVLVNFSSLGNNLVWGFRYERAFGGSTH